MRTGKRVNPFVRIYQKCNSGNNLEKWKKMLIGGYPRYIDVEVTNHCNLGCYMCPVGTRAMKRQRGYMSMELVEKLYAELKDSSVGV